MRYASVCDGIGAAHVAWQPLGWECAWVSEIEPFPAAVVDQRWGHKNLGDMTAITEEMIYECGPVDVLVGGTPCQSFSVAGLRKGLDDPRGNLALRFVQLVNELRPSWVVWENVPGVLSTNEGRDFGAFLGALADSGYGFAYRVLDAQWFGVAQRRRRVFVVASSRDWQCAAAVLFEPESMRGNSAPSRTQGKKTAGNAPPGTDGSITQTYDVGNTLTRRMFKGFKSTLDEGQTPVVYTKRKRAQSNTDDETWEPGDVAPTFNCFDQGDIRATTIVCGETSGTLRTNFRNNSDPAAEAAMHVVQDSAVRRLTPREAERLQGFPDDYTMLEGAGRGSSESARYKALGNSMAVPVVRWIGGRIALCGQVIQEIDRES